MEESLRCVNPIGGEEVEVMEEVWEGGIDILLDHIDETRTKFNHYVELKILS